MLYPISTPAFNVWTRPINLRLFEPLWAVPHSSAIRPTAIATAALAIVRYGRTARRPCFTNSDLDIRALHDTVHLNVLVV